MRKILIRLSLCILSTALVLTGAWYAVQFKNAVAGEAITLYRVRAEMFVTVFDGYDHPSGVLHQMTHTFETEMPKDLLAMPDLYVSYEPAAVRWVVHSGKTAHDGYSYPVDGVKFSGGLAILRVLPVVVPKVQLGQVVEELRKRHWTRRDQFKFAAYTPATVPSPPGAPVIRGAAFN